MHGVKPVIRGRRCAMALWFTLDSNYDEKVSCFAGFVSDANSSKLDYLALFLPLIPSFFMFLSSQPTSSYLFQYYRLQVKALRLLIVHFVLQVRKEAKEILDNLLKKDEL